MRLDRPCIVLMVSTYKKTCVVQILRILMASSFLIQTIVLAAVLAKNWRLCTQLAAIKKSENLRDTYTC
jgi:hypothetical protein